MAGPSDLRSNSEPLTSRRVADHSSKIIFSPTTMESIDMTNTERSTYQPSSMPNGSSSGADAAAAASKDDLASQGAAAFREVKANVESVIANAGEKGQQALNYAGRKGQEAMDNVRDVGDT